VAGAAAVMRLGQLRPSAGAAPVAAGGRTELAVVVPMIVEHVRVSDGPPGDSGPHRTLPVPLDLFRAARPDLWWVHGPTIAAHLEEHHQAELRALAGVRGGVLGTRGVVVRDVGPEGMVLTCLTLEGVTDQVIPFDPPLEEPAQLGAWWLRAR
jgi:hypothetical protein